MRNGQFLTQAAQSAQANSFVVKGLINQNQLAMGAAPPGEGKSILAEAIAYAVAYEAPVAGMATTPGNVVIVDSENPTLADRIVKIKKGFEHDGYSKKHEIDIQHCSGLLLDNEPTWDPLLKVMDELQPILVIFDHMACFHHLDENSSSAMERVSEALEQLKTKAPKLLQHRGYPTAILILHHFGKNEGTFFKRLRGSSAIYAKTDSAFEVRTLVKNDGYLEKFGVIPQSRKDITPAPFRVEIKEGFDWMKLIKDGPYKPLADPKMDLICHRVYESFLTDPKPKTVMDVLSVLAGMATQVETRDCLHNLEERGLLTAEQEGKQHKWVYDLPDPVKACPWCGKGGQTV